jgi:hypothetical protein
MSRLIELLLLAVGGFVALIAAGLLAFLAS